MLRRKKSGKISLMSVTTAGLFILVTVILSGALLMGTGCTPKNTELNVYTALEEEHLEPYLSSFKSQYPNITINITRDSTGIVTA